MSWRAGIATHSKFRNVYGEPYRKDKSYENIRMSKNSWDGTYCAVNPKFLAVVLDTSGGGGAFLVIPIEKIGHQKTDLPRVIGHQREVLDIQWNPFNDHIIASASEDTSVKIWRIPSGGLTEDLLDPLVDLRGHQRKVGIIQWHPTANGIIASAAFDFKVIVWNALKAKALCTIEGHRDTIFDLAFNYNGSLLATTSKDKKIRVMNARTGKILQTIPGHSSPKPSHVSFTDKIGDHLVSSGFSNSGEREIALWSLEKGSRIKTDAVDHSSSILMLHYDMDIKVAYVAGKGDGMIRYYEVRREEPFLFRLAEYRHATPQKSLGKISKRGLDTNKCEIFRFYKIHAETNWIEPVSMICPRRSDEFQEDLYPPFPSMQPAMTAEEWMSGVDKDPNLMTFTEGGGVQQHVSAGSSSADKYNSMFNKPAKFEKQLSKDGLLSNNVSHNALSPKSTIHEVHDVNDEEFLKFQKLCKEQGEEIEKLKRTMTAKDQRIFKLEMELTSKDAEISEVKEQLAKKVTELKETNRRLEASRADVSSVDGRPPQAGEVTVTKTTSQVRVQSMPGARPIPVEEAITPSQRTKKPLDDYDIQQALSETNMDLGRGADVSRATVRTVNGQSSRTTAQYREEPEAGNSINNYRIEDIDAELESLRDDLAKTRDQRQSSKTSVRHVSEDMGRGDRTPRGGGYSRTVYTDSTSTTEVTTPRQDNTYDGGGSPPKYGYHGGLSPPKSSSSAEAIGVSSGTSGSEGTRMVITTASYARVPSVERQSKDKKSYL